MMGPETVEVSTFRAADAETAEKDEHGRVLRDNVFGTQEEDARRRDFTVNALYYDPATEEVVDFHGGLADLKKRVMRIIGDPETRYREDPVRMLRAVRLAAKLGLTLDAGDARADPRNGRRCMEHVPPARLFDEMLKLLLSGHASACLRQLREDGLHKGLLPLLDVILEQPLGERFVTLALAQTDERVLAERPVSPGVPVRRAALARGARRLEGAAGARRAAGSRARVRRWTRCSTRSATSSPSRASSPRRCARSGRCSRASRSARASAPTACSSRRASAWPTTSSRCARRAAKCRRSSRPGGAPSRAPTTRRARPCCCPTPAPQQAPPPAPAQGRAGRARGKTPSPA